jgi:hypothetical protein
MTISADIRGVLAAGPHNAKQIAELIDCTAKQAAQNLSALKTNGKVKAVGSIDGLTSYAMDDWPEKSLRGGDTPPLARKARGKKARCARAAETDAAAPALNGNGADRDQFSITDSGVLAIKQGESVIHLHRESFSRLRTFVERAESIFNATE